MRLSSKGMKDRNMLFDVIPYICASSPKNISIYNVEMIVARCFIVFFIFSRTSLGKTFKDLQFVVYGNLYQGVFIWVVQLFLI